MQPRARALVGGGSNDAQRCVRFANTTQASSPLSRKVRRQIQPLLGAIALGLVAVTAASCGGSTPTRTPAPFTVAPLTLPPLDAEALARDLLSDNLSEWVDDGAKSPSLIDWESVVGNVPLSDRQRDMFCNQLDSTPADDVLGGVVSAGLNWLSLRFRKKPLSTDADDIVRLTAQFAVKACPLWVPGLIPDPTLAPIEPWYPADFHPLIADPGVAWRWIPSSEAECGLPGACSNVEVVARDGCSDIFMAVAFYDTNDIVVDLGSGSVGATRPDEVRRIELTSNVPTSETVSVDFIACF
jgi:hypothetical protein